MAELLLSRQSILNERLKTYAYTLNYQFLTDPDHSVNHFVAVIDAGIEYLAADHDLYIEGHGEDIGWLVDFCAPNPRLGLLFDYRLADECDIGYFLPLCAQRGIRVALRDFPLDKTTYKLYSEAALGCVRTAQVAIDDLSTLVKRMRGHRASPCAVGLQTQVAVAEAREAGFQYFQGSFLADGSEWKNKTIPQGLISPLRVLATLQDPDVSVKDVEQLVKADASFSYRILRLVNSAYYGIDIEIQSVGHAIVYLGMGQLKNWLSLMTLANMATDGAEVLTLAAIRARMAELLAPSMELEASKAFTLGLFSLLDVIAHAPMSKVLAELPLPQDLRAALIDSSGLYAPLLKVIQAYEKGDWTTVRSIPLNVADISGYYLNAVEWATAHQLIE